MIYTQISLSEIFIEIFFYSNYNNWLSYLKVSIKIDFSITNLVNKCITHTILIHVIFEEEMMKIKIINNIIGKIRVKE